MMAVYWISFTPFGPVSAIERTGQLTKNHDLNAIPYNTYSTYKARSTLQCASYCVLSSCIACVFRSEMCFAYTTCPFYGGLNRINQAFLTHVMVNARAANYTQQKSQGKL